MPRRASKVSQMLTEDSYYYLCNLHELGIDPYARELYLTGEAVLADNESFGEPGVEFSMVSRLIKNLRTLQLDSLDPVLIHMKTCGGFWLEGMAAYDTIAACPCHVTILNYTHARSMSSLIFQAADLRVMMPYSEFMFHHGSYAFSGELVTAISDLDQYKRSMSTMCDIYARVMKDTPGSKWTKTSLRQIREWLRDQMAQKNDVFLSAQEAVDNGFADQVFDGNWEALK